MFSERKHLEKHITFLMIWHEPSQKTHQWSTAGHIKSQLHFFLTFFSFLVFLCTMSTATNLSTKATENGVSSEPSYKLKAGLAQMLKVPFLDLLRSHSRTEKDSLLLRITGWCYHGRRQRRASPHRRRSWCLRCHGSWACACWYPQER